MSPIERPRNLGEVGIYLQQLDDDLKEIKDKDLVEIMTELNAIKREARAARENSDNKKLQVILLVLSTIVSPIIVALIMTVLRNSV